MWRLDKHESDQMVIELLLRWVHWERVWQFRSQDLNGLLYFLRDMLATQGCSRSLTQAGVWSCRAVITTHHTVTLFSYNDDPVKDKRNEEHPRGNRHTQSRLRSDRRCTSVEECVHSSPEVHKTLKILCVSGMVLAGDKHIQVLSFFLIKKSFQKVWLRKSFQLQEFKCWAQELSYFNVKSILSVCGPEASRSHITLAKCMCDVTNHARRRAS